METLTKRERLEFILRRDGKRCAICHKNVYSDMTIDHWIPRSEGGTDDLSNLRIAHKKCNAWKGNRRPNADGTIPPKAPKKREVKHKQRKREILESICEECYDGRLLLEDENCPSCGVMAGPPDWPHWAKRRADKCDHTAPMWCWACSIGIIDRKPVFLVLLEGN
jgi:hypothetical protein